MGFVEQAFGPITEFACHQLGDQPAIRGVGNRQQEQPVGFQEALARGQHGCAVPQVLKHVGTDNDVVWRVEQLTQVLLLEVGDHDAPVVRSRQRSLFLAQCDPIDGCRALLSGQIATDGTAAAAEVQHVCTDGQLLHNGRK